MWGLPGGSSYEGPATTAGYALVLIVALVVLGLLLGLLFYITDVIQQPAL